MDNSTPSSQRSIESLHKTHCLELMSTFQQLTGIGVWVHDISTEETLWSRQAKEIQGVDPGQTLSFAEFVARYTDSHETTLLELFDQAVTESDGFTVDAILAGGGTTKRSVRLHCEPHQSADGDRFLYGTVQDITDVKRREQRIEVLRETSQELRSVSSRQDVAEIIADAAKNILGLVNTTIRLIDTNDRMLRTVVATEECLERAGDRPDYSVDEETPAARTFRTGEPELHADHDMTKEYVFTLRTQQQGLPEPVKSSRCLGKLA